MPCRNPKESRKRIFSRPCNAAACGFEGVKSSPEIHRLGIYFARYNYLFTFNVEDVISSDALQALCKWFKKTLSASQVEVLIRPVTRETTIKRRF